MARFPQTKYSKIFERYIKGESLADIHKDYIGTLELATLQLYASRHNWSKYRNSIKIELKKVQVYKDEKRNYANTIIATMEEMSEAKQKRIKISSSLLEMLGGYINKESKLSPRELATIASALSVVCDIQRTEFGEASIITQNHNLNANYSLDEKKKMVVDLRKELAEYESHNKSVNLV